MAIVTPQTDLILLQCPLELDQQNQITFTSTSEQQNYFRSLTKLEVTDFTYQRKDGTVRFPALFEDIRTYNYCMYRNANYSNKWFYCFITDRKYANDNVTEIKLETDVWQTWQLSVAYHPCFVEREHVSDDSIGKHTLDEGLTTGEYIINSFTNKTICAPDVNGAYICLSVSEAPTYKTSTGQHNAGDPITSAFVSRVYNGIIQGTYLYLFDYSNSGAASLSQFINWYDKNGKGDAIQSVFALPKKIYPAGSITNHSLSGDPFTASFHQLVFGLGATDMGTTTLSINNNLNGYVPHNNKLFCFPYNYILATNNHGVNNIYHYEDFSTPSSVTFKYNGVVTEGSSVKCYPVNYKKHNGNYSGYSFGLDMQATPTFSWTNDMYLNWKAQNSWQGMSNAADRTVTAYTNQPKDVSDAGGFFGYLGGVLEKGAAYVGSTINAITNTISGASYRASVVPDQTNGQTTGDVNFSIGRCGFTFHQMSIKAEIARIIDGYFDMYGYKVARLKYPNITTRRYWNYVKCTQVNITGQIPQEDLEGIKQMFLNGVTLWHDPSKYLDYSQNNAIV